MEYEFPDGSDEKYCSNTFLSYSKKEKGHKVQCAKGSTANDLTLAVIPNGDFFSMYFVFIRDYNYNPVQQPKILASNSDFNGIICNDFLECPFSEDEFS